MLKAWCEYNYQSNSDVYTAPQNEILWYNSHIRVQGKPVFMYSAYNQGLMYVNQLFENGTTKSAIRVVKDYGITFLEYNSLLTAIPKKWKDKAKTGSPVEISNNWSKLKNIENISSIVYEQMIHNEEAVEHKRKKWEIDIGKNISKQDFLNGFTDIKRVTNITKFRSFQYRLLQRAIVTNTTLEKWGITPTGLCYYCEEDAESYVHLFVMCRVVRDFWIKVESFMKNYSQDVIHFDVDTIFWNRIVYSPKGHVKNLICLVAKQFIYRQRCLKEKLNFQTFVNYIRTIEMNEKYYAVKYNRLHKHFRKWYPDKTQENNENETLFIQEYVANIVE